jgi:hypothetical protein
MDESLLEEIRKALPTVKARAARRARARAHAARCRGAQPARLACEARAAAR